MTKIHEECGVFGIISPQKCHVAASTYYGLFALQHRGQESCGIVVNDDGVFKYHRDEGIVNDVFTREVMDKLGMGNMALGHVRYGTSDTKGRANAQPMVVNHIKGHTALAFNGSIINYDELRKELELGGAIFHTNSDIEVIAYEVIKYRLTEPSLEKALEKAMDKIKGAYSIVMMSPTKLIAARDKHGFRPLCFGQTGDGSYVVASESCALDSVSANLIRELESGEIVVFDKDGIKENKTHCNKCDKALCIFEYIYFARPDSVIEGKSVHKAKLNAGKYLAMEHPVEADVVIGVPDSGLDAAMGYARQSGIPYGIGFVKNKYIGRTFIVPGQDVREDKVKIKLNVIADTVKDKRVVLVDDSIVRGTTSAIIVRLLREAGAKEVHLRSSAPAFMNPCYYGTDIASRDVLIACNYTHSEMEKIIGVDSLGFLSVDNLCKLIDVPDKCGYCDACFTNNYPTEVPPAREERKYNKKLSEKEVE